MKVSVQKRKSEAGQATALVVLALSFFLVGAVGFGIDGSHLYAERQKAQAAADAAAQAGAMSMFDGTNGSGTHAFSTSSLFTCGASDAKTPCYYAESMDGAASTPSCTIPGTSDCIQVDFPAGSAPVLSQIRVTVQKSVGTILMSLLGPSAAVIQVSGTAAIVNVVSPVPIIITHPTMAGALSMNGNTGITITGGPQESIQVNSNGSNPSGNTVNPPSSGSIDLSGAGPSGTGGDFGNFGGPSSKPSSINVGSTGRYYQHSPIPDPLAGVAAPSVPTTTPPQTGQSCTVLGHCSNCPAPGFSGSAPSTCTEYLPGVYSTLNLTGVNSAFFDPGIYYIEGGGFKLKNDTVAMCSSCAADATTGNGMLIYDTCAAAPACSAGSDATGGFTIDTNADAILLGAGVSSSNLTSAPSSPYYGILFFEDHNADAQSHNLGAGNGCFSVIGTIYITNTLSIMNSNASHYQSVTYHGTPCSSTQNYGEIIVSQLTVVGTSGINMGLFPQGYLTVREVALVR